MWSKTKKALMERMAPSLRGKVVYDLEYCRPHYRTDPPATSKCTCFYCAYHRFFQIIINKKDKVMIANNKVYRINDGWITAEAKKNAGLFEMSDVAKAMHLYLNVYSVQECLNGTDPLLYLFAVMDRRIGKRTLLRLYQEREHRQQWLWRFLELRLDAEGICRS